MFDKPVVTMGEIRGRLSAEQLTAFYARCRARGEGHWTTPEQLPDTQRVPIYFDEVLGANASDEPHVRRIARERGWSAEELRHAEENQGNQYGRECGVPIGSGRVLCSPAHPESCSYVRIVQDGYELAYWTSAEWQDDPEGVMGAHITEGPYATIEAGS